MKKRLFYLALFLAPMGAQFMTFSIGTFQMSPFRAVILAEAVCIFVSCLRGNMLKLFINNKQKDAVIFHFLWFAYAIATVLWAKNSSSWFKSIYFLFIGSSGILIAINVLDDTKSVKTSLFSLQLGIIVQSVIGWYEIITRNYLFKSMTGANYIYYVQGNQRVPIAMLGNPNDFATLMFFGIIISLLLLQTQNKLLLKIFNIFMTANCAALLIMSVSRANILALLIAVSFLVVIKGNRKWLLLIGIFILALLVPQLTSFLEETLKFNFNAANGSDVVRLNLIRNGFRFLVTTLGFGVGSGQIESWMSLFAVGYVENITNMHNWWMEILTAYGVLIFAGYVCFYFSMFSTFYKSSKIEDEVKKNISIYICAAMLGFVIASVSSSSNISSEWLWMFWAICIAYLGTLHLDRKDGQIYE